MKRFIAVVAARPNFMKMAPLLGELARSPLARTHLVHTGQHYDRAMSELFFEQLGMPRPDADLGVGSGSHAHQTAEVMKRFEPIVLEHKPDAVIVAGDVNSTLACALVAAKLNVPVAHIESGLRSFDRAMPEEINRILTDAISDWLFVTEESGVENLKREGADPSRIHFVGNLMIDALCACREIAERSTILERLSASSGGYAVLTLHRPSNVDDPSQFRELMGAIERVQRELPIVFPVHPRTRDRVRELDLPAMPRLILTEPLGYLDFLKLTAHARLVLTDSGGIQEETTVLGVPCLTLRKNTERPVTVTLGTNRLVGQAPERIVEAALEILSRPRSAKPAEPPPLWDGHAAKRVADVLLKS